MRTLTVEASSPEVARGLYDSLSEFDPEIIGSADEGYAVRVSLAAGDEHIVAVLNALERHVEARRTAAQVDLDGRTYTINPQE
ncbi:MAG TPA: hypothetical protein VJT84_12745 [Gaiellaceae bacterium]|nr:hypothetical protein [Gaiellaceae bacterium]